MKAARIHNYGQPLVLEEADGHRTRLIVRARGGRGYQSHGLPRWLTKRIIPGVHFLMQRKQLLGLAARAEARPPNVGATASGETEEA